MIDIKRPLIISLHWTDCTSRDVHIWDGFVWFSSAEEYVPGRKDETCSKVKIQHVSCKAGRQAGRPRQAGRQVETKKSPQFEGLLPGLWLNEYIRPTSRVLQDARKRIWREEERVDKNGKGGKRWEKDEGERRARRRSIVLCLKPCYINAKNMLHGVE